ncbi:MAG: hypothetical protein K2M95_06670, partial [Clostridiales bacterium]|nr:hypothetical protein [Clostridiales bacterium]
VEVIMTLLDEEVQTSLVAEEKLQLPLFKTMENDFLDTENNDVFSPLSRSIYLEVISGRHGRISDVYKSYETTWHDDISTKLFEYIYDVEAGKGKGIAAYNDHYNDDFKNDIQSKYNNRKND